LLTGRIILSCSEVNWSIERTGQTEKPHVRTGNRKLKALIIVFYDMICLIRLHLIVYEKMKLKPDFITQVIEDTQFLVPVGAEAFRGIVRSNRTAAFIVDCLKEETTEKMIVDVMCRQFDAPRETIAVDVAEVIATLRRINAIEE